MKTVTRFTADDGETFDTAEACKAHEAEAVTKKLVGLTLEQIVAAIDRKDIPLATALEEIGARCNRARLAAGEVRRKTVRPETQTPPPPLPPTNSGKKAGAKSSDGAP